MMIFVALVGATLIVVRGTIFGWLRRLWPAFFGCSQCFGTWVGIAAGAGGLVSIVGQGRFLDALAAGCATSILSLLTDGVLIWLLGDPLEDEPSSPTAEVAETKVVNEDNSPRERVTKPPPRHE